MMMDVKTASMTSLQERLMDLREIVPPQAPVVHFDYAVYHNVGDLLLSKATERFFDNNGNRVIDCYCIQNYRKALTKSFPDDAVFVFQGGGNFGDVHAVHQQLRESVLTAHPRQKSVVFPQSIFYKDPEKLAAAESLFTRFENLTLCARDEISYQIFTTNFRNPCLLLPDTAHLLQGAFAKGNAQTVRDKLYFVRQDHAGFEEGVVQALDDAPDDDFLDWSGFLSSSDWAMMRAGYYAHRLDEKTLHTMLPARLWRIYRDRLLERSVKLFFESGEVVTNRLHGLILAMLTGTPVSAFDTGHGKISAYYQTWLQDEPGVGILTPDIHEGAMTPLVNNGAD